MTASLRLSSIVPTVPVSASHQKHGATSMKNLSGNLDDHACASRRWFSSLLWVAFPATSENDLAHKAARVLNVSPRQVRNWLRCENDPSLRYVTLVIAIAGAEAALQRFAA